VAGISDYGWRLDPEWTVAQRQVVRALIEEACEELQKAEAFPAEEAVSWKILDGQGVFSRGMAHIPTAPSIELGRAVCLLLEGALPAAPAGTWWFYGVPDGLTTIRKRKMKA
jgi:hypothetical protein